MTATERLRQLLDERGVEWTYGDGTVSFDNGERWFHAWAYNDGMMCVSMGYLTPEQAVEATLGHELDDAAMVKLHDMLNVALLQLEDASDDHEARITAVDNAHRLLEEAATLGRGTCRMCKRKGYDREYLHHYECSECGEEVLRASVMGESEPPRFCPECGRRVIGADDE